MRLGIVVTDINQAAQAQCVVKEALAYGWSLRCFLTENGVNMLKDDSFIGLARNHGLHLSVCEHSVARYCHELPLQEISDVVIVGGQYQDAELVRHSDRVLVF
ncbi:MAG: hypothetical protein HQL49_00835 [Gammaproteobacteria bacterium]|nr:hypothetical protein [Gammaproteobacteria bacterium]